MAVSGLKRVDASFFMTERGSEPVRDWLRSLDRGDRREIGRDLMTLEFGWPVGLPQSRPMGKGLHELRSTISGGREARVLFYLDRQQRLILLHAFIKRSRTTPKHDLDIARERMQLHQRSVG